MGTFAYNLSEAICAWARLIRLGTFTWDLSLWIASLANFQSDLGDLRLTTCTVRLVESIIGHFLRGCIDFAEVGPANYGK